MALHLTFKLPLLALGLLILSGCTAHTKVSTEGTTQDVVAYRDPEPNGVVPYVWEEPMVDVIDVPPGLDPEGHYHRPAHQSIVEIRQGRWQYYRKGE